MVLLAAHDDGSGTHVTIRHLCRALLERFRTCVNRPLIVYLNSTKSRRQQSQTRNAGLCHSACLSRIQDAESAFGLILEKLNSPSIPPCPPAWACIRSGWRLH